MRSTPILIRSAAAFAGAISFVALGQDAPDLESRLASLQARLEASRVEKHVPGMSLAIVLDDRIVLARGFGLRDVEAGLPADEHTKYAIGSSTKAFTSLLVAMMVDEGKMAWDEPVRTHSPAFHLSDPEADAQVTIRDLLCHRSGLARTDLLWYGGGASREQIFAAVARAELKTPFRSAFNYNNIGYLASGLAAAGAAGTDWATLVRDRILSPLGMDATDTSVEEMQRDPSASKGYLWLDDTGAYKSLPLRPVASCAPAGAINSTVLDMSRWLRFQLGRGEFEGRRLVSEAALRETWVHQIDMQPGVGYGLGWMLHKWNGTPVVEHGGNIDGFAAEVAMLPEKNAGFVLLTNVSATPLTAEAQGLIWETLFPPPAAAAGAMSEAELAPYTGKYRFDRMGVDVTVLTKEGRLYCDVPGQMAFELKEPDAEGMWVFALTDTIKLRFQKGPDSSVPFMTLHQAGMEFRLPRVNPDGSLAHAPEAPSPFTADALRGFAGTYHLAEANQDWRILVKDGRLAADVPGQMVYTLNWPDADGRWSFLEVPAVRVSFERNPDGQVERMVCEQGGGSYSLARTAPGDDAGLPGVDEIMALRAGQTDPGKRRARGTIRVRGSVRFAEQGIDATLLGLSDGQGRFMYAIDMGPFGSIRVASDGQSVWTASLGQPVEEIAGAQAASTRREAGAMFVQDLRAEFSEVEVLRKEVLDGREVVVVRGRNPGSADSVTEYVSPQDGMPLKREAVVMVPGLGSIPTTSLFGEYKDFDGLLLPATITTDSLGTGRSITNIEAVETQVQAEPDDFRIQSP